MLCQRACVGGGGHVHRLWATPVTPARARAAFTLPSCSHVFQVTGGSGRGPGVSARRLERWRAGPCCLAPGSPPARSPGPACCWPPPSPAARLLPTPPSLLSCPTLSPVLPGVEEATRCLRCCPARWTWRSPTLRRIRAGEPPDRARRHSPREPGRSEGESTEKKRAPGGKRGVARCGDEGVRVYGGGERGMSLHRGRWLTGPFACVALARSVLLLVPP